MNKQIELDSELLNEVVSELTSYLSRNYTILRKSEVRVFAHPLILQALRQIIRYYYTGPEPIDESLIGVPIVEGYELAVVICAPSRFNAEIVKLEITNK